MNLFSDQKIIRVGWRILLTSSVFALSAGPARAMPHLNFTLDAKERRASDQLKHFLSNYTYSLDRQLVTFHYQSGEGSTVYRPKSLEEIVDASKTWGSEFFNVQNVGNDEIGPGHYVSTDLTGSRNFGGTVDPQLYVTVLRPQAKILDIRSEIDAKENDFAKLEKVFSCEVKDKESSAANSQYSAAVTAPTGASMEEWFRFFRSSNLSCRKVLLNAMAELNVEAVIYSYSAASSLSECRHARAEALLIIQSSAFDPRQLAYFSSDNNYFDPNNIGGSLRELYREGEKDYSQIANWPDEMKIPSALSSFKSTKDKYKLWKEANVYKCGPTWKREKSDSGILEGLYLMSDSEIAHLHYRLSRAYRNKFKDSANNFFQIHRLRGLNQFYSRLLGLEFETLTKVINFYDNYSGDRSVSLTAITELLGEAINTQNLNQNTYQMYETFSRLLKKA
jgi:hypothetical protein